MNNSTSKKSAFNRCITNWERTVAKEGKSSKEAQRLQQRLVATLFDQREALVGY